jgi:hypothetical protein
MTTPAPLRCLTLPLAGRSSVERGPLGVQSLPSEDGFPGSALLLCNDAAGSTRAFWWSDDESPVRIVIGPSMLSFAELALAAALLGVAS